MPSVYILFHLYFLKCTATTVSHTDCHPLPLPYALPICLGLLDGFRNDYTLARRQTIGLDHVRLTAFGDVRQRRFDLGKHAILRGRNRVAFEERLGERLRRFKLRGGLRRPEDAPARSLERIDDAKRKRRFRAHHREEIGRAHVSTPVTNAHLVCRLLPEKTKH